MMIYKKRYKKKKLMKTSLKLNKSQSKLKITLKALNFKKSMKMMLFQNKKRPLEDQQTAYNRNKGPRVERGGKRGGRGTFEFRGRGKAGGSNPETPKN